MAKSGPERIPLLEWAAAFFGLVVVVVMVAVLVLDGLRERDGAPPLLTVQPLRIASAPGQYVVEIQVNNATRKTGASVQVEGKLMKGASDVETSNATLTYVPGRSHRRAGLVFTHDPRKYRMSLRVTGFARR